MRIDLATIHIKAIADALYDAFGDDDRLITDSLEGETDLFELASRLLNSVERDDGEASILKEQIDNRKLRMDRCKSRNDARREALCALMEAARQDKLVLPEATVSLRYLASKIAVNDPNAVPDEYTAIKRVPDKALIDAAFTVDDETLPNWLRVDPSRPSLTVRRK